MKGPKITVIGAGSYFFGKPVIHKMATSPIMARGTLALVDIDKRKLETMTTLAKRIFKFTKCEVNVISSTDRKEVMEDSDFVVLTFSYKNAYYRKIDTEIAFKHGIRMCSSDTIGPGGIFRALRELPEIINIAKDVKKLCPQAWVINFVNPTSVMGIALKRYMPEVKSFAICDGHHEPYNSLMWCKRVGILPEESNYISPDIYNKLELKIGGVNHCTWLVKFNFNGKDMMPKVKEWAQKEREKEKRCPSEKAKPRYNFHYALQLFEIYNAYPTAISHTKEYVPFFQGYGKSEVFPEPIRCFDADLRRKEMMDDWKITEKYSRGELSEEEFIKNIKDDHATDIIESMWGDLGKKFYINTFNNGAVSNMPLDAFLELRCDIDMKGPRPQPFGEFPRGLLALQHQILDTHELTAQAALTGDKRLLKLAMATDPICNNLGDIERCIEDLLQAEKDILPSYWY